MIESHCKNLTEKKTDSSGSSCNSVYKHCQVSERRIAFGFAKPELASGKQQRDTSVIALRRDANSVVNVKTQKMPCRADETQIKADGLPPEQ